MKKLGLSLLTQSKFKWSFNQKWPKICCQSSGKISREFATDTKDNLTAVLYGIEDLRLEQRPIPEICDDEVLLQMDTVGICGSDVHFLTHGRIGDFVVKKPMVVGHEAAGIVAKLGASVKSLKVGDRVAIEPGVPCRVCDFDFCFKLPDHVSLEEGALLEPLSVGVHSCRRAGVGLGSDVLVLGAGPIGLTTLITARAMGASSVTITSKSQSRLDVAKDLCATNMLLVKEDDKPKDLVKKIEKLCGGIKPDITIDCVASHETVVLGILATRSGGCCTVVGMLANEANIPIIDSVVREVDVRGVFRYCNDYPAALALVTAGKADVKRLVTHHFDITETAKAFETARCRYDNAIKVLIHPRPRK